MAHGIRHTIEGMSMNRRKLMKALAAVLVCQPSKRMPRFNGYRGAPWPPLPDLKVKWALLKRNAEAMGVELPENLRTFEASM
jgi:hypothetical protein